MTKLSILITEKFPASLRGEITRWMIEVKSGVFIGTLSRLVRDLLWEKISKNILKGGAIFIEPAANEQKYQIKSIGSFSRTSRNFEGINLMTIPTAPSTNNAKKNSTNSTKFNPFTYFANRLDIKPGMAAKISWPTPKNFPPNLITRTFSIRLENNQYISNYAAKSSYFEYPPERVWAHSEISEIQSISKFCLDLWNMELKNHPEKKSEKILSFSLETTDYSPKAAEGYVNVIGLCSIYVSQETQCPTLSFHQGFNMTRQRSQAPALLFQFWPFFQNIDQLILMHREKILSQFSLLSKENKFTPPEFLKIYDISEHFSTIEELIELFNSKCNQDLTLQYSSKFSEYYQMFKGDAVTQIQKNIIPIGRFNLLKIILGLYFYLLKSGGLDEQVLF